jgi:DHA2 family multidrug resistance protein-like MFS transporter
MQDTTLTGAGLQAGRREWLGLAVLALPTLLLALDQSVLYLALPHLSADLGAGSTQSLWILDIYGFMLAGFLVTMGTLGDRIGRRRLLLIGAAAFGVATVVAAYSNSAEMLIATRALMGVAGATLMPSTLALISNMFADAKQRGVAIAAWFSALMVGGALGPVIGGALLESFWWGSVFLMGAPVMVLLLVAGPVLLPEYRDPQAGRLDLPSVALSLVAILPVIYGIKELAKDGFAAGPIVALVLGVAFGTVFVLRQRRLTSPMLDLRLFRSRTFNSALTILMFSAFTTGGIYLLVSLYLQNVEGLSPLRAGLWLLPAVFAAVIGSMITPGLAQKVRPSNLIAAGLLLTAFGYLLLTQVGPEGGLALLVVGFVVAFLGGGPMGALGTNLVVSAAPPEKAGSAASTSETSTHLGIALGIAILGSIGNAVYRGRVDVPDGAPEVAGESVSNAVAAAGQLPAATAEQLLTSARDAFTSGLNAAAVVGMVLFLGLAALAGVALRQIQLGGPAPSTEPEAAAADEEPRVAVVD